jgi:arylsulfatase A-like enzyme
LVAWWPGTVRPESVSRHRSAFWDLLPTACELAGAEPPTAIDGISFVPTLLGKDQRAHDHLFWKFGNNKQAVRKGRWKAVKLGGKPTELYDLEADIGEAADVASRHADVVAELQEIMAKAQGSLRTAG